MNNIGTNVTAENIAVKKTSQACDHCHKRRIKCQFEASVGKCLNCYRLSQNCTFHRVPQKRGPHRKRKNDAILNYFRSQSVGGTVSDGLNYLDPNNNENTNNNTNNTNPNAMGQTLPFSNNSNNIPQPNNINNNNNHSHHNSTSLLHRNSSIDGNDFLSQANLANNQPNLQPIVASQETCIHNLSDILQIYYTEVHPQLSIFPVDTVQQFQDIILNNLSQWKLRLLFHSILETIFYGDEMEKLNEWKSLWKQLVVLDYMGTPMDDCIYILCHFLICFMSPTNSKILGHCIGSFNEMNGRFSLDLKVRLYGMIELIDLLNVKFKNFNDRMCIAKDKEDMKLLPSNVSEIITLLKSDSNITLSRHELSTLSPLWYEYQGIITMRQQFTECVNNKQSYGDITTTLCSLIHAMLQVLIHIDNDKYTDSLLQIVKNKSKSKYKFEFGLKMIINKITELLDIIKDTPSFLINMVILSTENVSMDTPDIDSMVTQLSNSMNELVQITTLTYKLGGANNNNPDNSKSSNNNSTSNNSPPHLQQQANKNNNNNNNGESFYVGDNRPHRSSSLPLDNTLFEMDSNNNRNNNNSNNATLTSNPAGHIIFDFPTSSSNNNSNSLPTTQETPRYRLHQLSEMLKATG